MLKIKGFTIAVSQAQFVKTKKSIEEIIDICLKSGFKGIEGTTSMFGKKSDQELERTGKLFRRTGQNARYDRTDK